MCFEGRGGKATRSSRAPRAGASRRRVDAERFTDDSFRRWRERRWEEKETKEDRHRTSTTQLREGFWFPRRREGRSFANEGECRDVVEDVNRRFDNLSRGNDQSIRGRQRRREG